MPKQPPAPGSKPINTKAASTEGTVVCLMTFAKSTEEATKNYTKFDPKVKDATAKTPILIGNNGLLYLRTDLVPKGDAPVTITITVG